MKVSVGKALVVLLVGTVTLAASIADEDEFGDPIHGQSLFASKGCVHCHAIRGAGGRIGPDLGRKATRNSYYDIAAVMWNHSQGMAGKMKEYRITRPTFEGDELSDLIAFLYFLHYFDEPGDPRAGQILFTEKQCIRCHRVGQEGGSVGPPLDAIPRGAPPLRLAQALWNHGPVMVASMRESGLEIPQFAGNEIIDLFAYIRLQGERQSARRFESPGDPVRGGELFDSKGCSLCHEIFGDEPGVGPDLGLVELRGSVTQIAGGMWNHWAAMAERMEQVGMTVPQFEGDELLDLFAYIYIVRFSGRDGDPEAGREVFEGKGCTICHGPEGRGAAGPDLRTVGLGGSKAGIMQRMWNHGPKMDALLESQNLSRAHFTPRELADLLSFLSSGLDPAHADGK